MPHRKDLPARSLTGLLETGPGATLSTSLTPSPSHFHISEILQLPQRPALPDVDSLRLPKHCPQLCNFIPASPLTLNKRRDFIRVQRPTQANLSDRLFSPTNSTFPNSFFLLFQSHRALSQALIHHCLFTHPVPVHEPAWASRSHRTLPSAPLPVHRATPFVFSSSLFEKAAQSPFISLSTP